MSAATLNNLAKRNDEAIESASLSGEDHPYRTLSRAAVLSVILATLSLFSFFFVGAIALQGFGLIAGILAIRAIRRYPAELTGLAAAKIGTVASAAMLCIAPSYHAYIYLTEVPEGYERVAFSTLINPVDFPTEEALKLDGKKVFIKGYIHPSSLSSQKATKFILVPDLGTCCFGGQPPLTHMIQVTLTGGQTVSGSFRQQKLAGTLKVDTQLKPIKELQGVFYQLKADQLK